MTIIPAVDIKEGRCVRLLQGSMDREIVYAADPVEAARLWEKQGARRLHVVDLDGALAGEPKNFLLIAKILGLLSIPVEVGGGIRTIEAVSRYLEAGARWVVSGSGMAEAGFFEELCRRFPGKIIAGIDSREGRVAVQGWTETLPLSPYALARRAQAAGAAALLVTDIMKDGMLLGPNLQLLEGMRKASSLPLIASGGVSSVEDIRLLKQIPEVSAAVVGRALYDGRLAFPAAQREADGGNRC